MSPDLNTVLWIMLQARSLCKSETEWMLLVILTCQEIENNYLGFERGPFLVCCGLPPDLIVIDSLSAARQAADMLRATLEAKTPSNSAA